METQSLSTVETFNAAMTLWFDLTGIDPDATSWRYGDWGIRQANEELQKCFALDESLITSFLLLDAYSENYFKSKTFSIAEFDEDEDKVFDYMDKVRQFKKLIRNPDIREIGERFIEDCRRALTHYKVDAERIEKFLSDRHRLAYLRRDALKSMANLRADHFLQGDVDAEGVRPLYNPVVFGYWNINSMIEHVCAMPSGISMNLIRDPDELHSYFAFAVRNGGNLIMLTDVPEYAHPLGRYMVRRPDREFDARVERNWFPYELLAISYDEEGRAYHDLYRESQAKGLVPHQPKHFVLKELKDLELASIVWTTLMFDRIVERYWNNPIPQKALSYTNEMIRLQDEATLIAAAAQSNLPVTGYEPLALKRLTIEDVKTAALDSAVVGDSQYRDRSGHNQWMEDRYAHLVPESALNLIGTDSKTLFLTTGDTKTSSFGYGKSLAVVEDEIKSMDAKDFDNWNRFNRESKTYPLERVDGTLFGTRAQVDADRKFIARVNFARAIQQAADAEYAKRSKEISAWYEARVRANLDTILDFAAEDAVMRLETTDKGKRKDRETYETRYQIAGTYDAVSPKRSRYAFGTDAWGAVSLRHEDCTDWDDPRCVVTGARYTYCTAIVPQTIEDLMLVTGCTRDDLPDVLQNWSKKEPYTGNHILSRIDPLDWALRSPWNRHNFNIRIYLSKRGLAQIRKTRTVPVLEPVLNRCDW